MFASIYVSVYVTLSHSVKLLLIFSFFNDLSFSNISDKDITQLNFNLLLLISIRFKFGIYCSDFLRIVAPRGPKLLFFR